MLPLDDPLWSELAGGHKTPYDPSDALRRLSSQTSSPASSDYKAAMGEMLELALADLRGETDRATTLSILGAIALAKGYVTLGAMISHSDESEIVEVFGPIPRLDGAFQRAPTVIAGAVKQKESGVVSQVPPKELGLESDSASDVTNPRK